jgi:hypothetical protein
VDEDHFLSYIAAFNAQDYDRMVTWYAHDVVLELPRHSPRGPAEIKAHYVDLHRSLRELLRVDWLSIGEDRLSFECYTEFHALADRPQFSLGPLRAGQVLRCTNFVHYDVRDGKFAAIRVARYKVWALEPSELDRADLARSDLVPSGRASTGPR